MRSTVSERVRQSVVADQLVARAIGDAVALADHDARLPGCCRPRHQPRRAPGRRRSTARQPQVRVHRRPASPCRDVDQIVFAIATAVSLMRFEKPHSLSYQAMTRQSVPSITLVWSMWKTEECGSWLKSVETSGSSVKPRMPFSRCCAAARIASLISSFEVSLLGDELEVDDRDVRRRHADRHAVELAVQLRQHEADRLGGAGRGRDHVQRRGARRGRDPCACVSSVGWSPV